MFNATSVCLRAGAFDEDGLRQTIALCQVMIEQGTTPGSADQALWLNLLSKTILALPDEAKNDQDLALGIRAADMAARVGAGQENQAALVYDLVGALIDRGLPGDLDEAVSQVQAALSRSPDWTQELQLLMALAVAYLKRFELTGADADQLPAIDAFCRVATSRSGQPRARGDAAFCWAKEATKRGDYAAACDAYQITVQLIAEQARRPGRPEQRNDWLARWAASARNGAACAIRAGRLGTALALLEQGRAVNVTQSLQRQADIAAVRALRPDLADRMTLLAKGIEAFAKGDRGELPRDYIEATYPLMQAMNAFETTAFEMNNPRWILEDPKRAEEWAREQLTELISNDTRLTLASRWDELMDELRCELPELPICVPPAVEDLVAAVSGGAAVVLNVSEIGCDALIIADGALSRLPLPELTESAIREMFVSLFKPIFRFEFGDRSRQARAELCGAMSDCQAWLWDTVCVPVLAALGIDGPPADGQAWPRIWWCPTGHLAALPIHAAGRFGPDGHGPCLIDRTVSSYTTTLGALAGACRAAAADLDPGRRRRLLAISVPAITGASVLGHTDLELDAVSPWVPANRPPLVGDAVTILHSCLWRAPAGDSGMMMVSRKRSGSIRRLRPTMSPVPAYPSSGTDGSMRGPQLMTAPARPVPARASAARAAIHSVFSGNERCAQSLNNQVPSRRSNRSHTGTGDPAQSWALALMIPRARRQPAAGVVGPSSVTSVSSGGDQGARWNSIPGRVTSRETPSTVTAAAAAWTSAISWSVSSGGRRTSQWPEIRRSSAIMWRRRPRFWSYAIDSAVLTSL